MDWMVLCYIGPETVLPLASAVSAVVGALLVFGRRLWSMIIRAARSPFRRKEE